MLGKSLFILNPTLRDALLAVRSECVDISGWGLLDLTTPTTKPGVKTVTLSEHSRGRHAKKLPKWPIAEATALPIKGAGGTSCRVEEFNEAQVVHRRTLSRNLDGARERLKMTVT